MISYTELVNDISCLFIKDFLNQNCTKDDIFKINLWYEPSKRESGICIKTVCKRSKDNQWAMTYIIFSPFQLINEGAIPNIEDKTLKTLVKDVKKHLFWVLYNDELTEVDLSKYEDT